MSEAHLEDLTDRIKPRAASNVLLWGIMAFVAIFFAWAALVELDRTVRGTGRVVPSSQLQVVSNLEGGVIQRIFVRAGQRVRQGDPLLLLDPTVSGSDFGSGSATVGALEIKAARLQSEASGQRPMFPVPRDDTMSSQIRIEQALYRSRENELAGLLAAGNARLAQAQRAVAEAESAYQARISTRDARQAEARMLAPLVERGIEPRLSLIQAEGAAATAASETAAAAAAITRAQAAVAEARASLNQAAADWRSRSSNELATTQAELEARRRTIPALAARVERTTVRAPLPGTVNRLLVHTVGAAVQPAQALVEIVPSDESLLVEVRVRPQDISAVRMGQAARVSLTAYDRSLYGMLDAKVVGISPDAVTEERTGETYYLVRVRTATKALRDAQGRAYPIGVGMVAEADLLGERRTILQYILTPITRINERAFRE